jgi:acetyl-CoA acetyltransferase
MSPADHAAEPVIAAPFRRSDYCLANEGATCLIVTTPELAGELGRPPVAIAGMEGVRCSRDDYILFARPGLGAGISAEFPLAAAEPPRIYRTSGVDRADIDGLYLYDSFASNPWMVLERFGFCGEGEAPAYIRDRGIGSAAALPVNTNGGLLSEAHLLGLGHLIEMVRQLRGEAGERQITGARNLQWATPIGDALILAGAR